MTHSKKKERKKGWTLNLLVMFDFKKLLRKGKKMVSKMNFLCLVSL